MFFPVLKGWGGNENYGVVTWYELLFFWINPVNLDFFLPRLSILFPMDLILHSFMLMLLQWSCLWYQRHSSMFTTSHPKAIGIRREATYWRQCMLNVSILLSNEIKSFERHERGQKASFPVLCVQGKRQQFGGNVNVMDCSFVSHCTEVWQETLGVWFRKK